MAAMHDINQGDTARSLVEQIPMDVMQSGTGILLAPQLNNHPWVRCMRDRGILLGPRYDTYNLRVTYWMLIYVYKPTPLFRADVWGSPLGV